MTIDQRRVAIRGMAVVALGLSLAGVHAVRAQAPAGQVDTSNSAADIESLKSDVEALQRMVPDQAHIMSDVDYHFSNLWFAAQRANWPLAEFYLGETRSHLTWAVRSRPVRKLSSGGDLNLPPILTAVLSGGLTDLKNAIDKKDPRAFKIAYRGMMGQCYGCHVAAEKPYLKLRIPEAPATRMIDLGTTGAAKP
jgi:hypothetical protein